jgi:hypothetical protein
MSLLNVGTLDRITRLTFGLTFFLAAFPVNTFLGGGPAFLCGALGAILLLTGAVGVCPLYMPFGIRTTHDNQTPD